MKRLILTLLLIVNITLVKAQVFTENFDGPNPVQFTSAGTPGWSSDVNYQVSGANSYRGQYGASGTTSLTSTSFSTVGNTYVILNFKQICKIEFIDTAKIEISVDNGATWTQVTSINSVYLGTGGFSAQSDRFCEQSYGIWQPGSTTAPANNWWQSESFDISVLAANQANVQVRFVAKDFSNPNGLAGRYGWLLDDIEVIASPCELIPPTITPTAGQPFWQNNIYNLGPYDVYMDFTDNTAFPITFGELYYTINGVPSQFGGMFPFTGLFTWYGQIPNVNAGDTVCWYVEATDNCGNLGRFPASGCVQFIASEGPSIPFCDDFELISGLWTTDSIDGTNWAIGAIPPGFNAHGGTNVAGIGMDGTDYLDNSNSSILTPIFDYSGITISVLEFYQLCQTENSYDGVNFQFSTDPTIPANPASTWTVIGVQNDANGTNWYNDASIVSSNQPGWTGTANTNWVKSTYKLGTVPNLPNQLTVQFKFQFTSDGIVTDPGFFIDDLCIYVPCGNDVGVSAIISPPNGFGIPAGSTTPVTVLLENSGTLPQTNFNIAYSINNGTPATALFTGTIAAQDTASFTIPGILAPAGAFTVCVWTELAGDCRAINDTICFNLIGIPTLGIPVCDDFEGANQGFYVLNDPNAVNNTNWELGTPTFGATSSANSGFNCWDVNLNTGYTSNALTYLYTPFYDCSTSTGGSVSFAMNYNTVANADGVFMEYSIDNGVTWNSMPNTAGCSSNWYNDNITTINGTTYDAWSGNSNGWIFPRYKLCCLPNVLGSTNKIQFRFGFSSDGFGTLDGVSIDDFCVNGNNTEDIGVYSLANTAPFAGAGSQFSIVASITNYSSTVTYTTFPISYSVTGFPTFNFIWTGTLPPCGSIDVTLPAFTMPSGAIDICVWTELPNDADLSNDTTCKSVIGVPVITPPNCDDFEGANVGWIQETDPSGNPGTVWELGTPAFGTTTGANSGTNAWDLNLTTAYTANAFNYLYSPFYDLSTISTGELSFAINFNTETGWDGARLEYTIDGGVTWLVADGDQTCVTNWYNPVPFPFGPFAGSKGFRGNSNGWVDSKIKLCCMGGVLGNANVVRFRFVFRSDGSVQEDGVSIDDFCIIGSSSDDIGVTSLAGTTPNGPVGTSLQVVATVTNFSGTSTVTSFPITYTTSTGVTNTITWTGSLGPCSSIDVVLPPFVVTQGAIDLCAWTSLSTDLNLVNDTSCTIVVGQPLITPTYTNTYNDDFENGNIGWAPTVVGDPGTEWEFGTPAFQTTTGAHSPVTCWDINLTTAPTVNANAILTSPYFDLTNANGAILKFWQNRDMDIFGSQFYIEYDINNANNWQKLSPANTADADNWYNNTGTAVWDDQSFVWIQSVLRNINDAIGSPTNPTLIQFRFVFITDAFDNSIGLSVDDFEMFVPIPLSVSTVAVNTTVPNQLIFPGQSISFSSPIKNTGINLIATTNATLTIDGTIISNDLINYTGIGGLLPDSSQIHSFASTWIAVPGFHEVCVYTDSPNGTQDLYKFDDTSCVTVLVFDSVTTNQLPFCTSFESGAQWVTANADSYRNQSIWELGTPSKPTLNSAHTGVNAWSTKLATDYSNIDSSGLFSSLFRVQAGHCYKLGYWQQYKMEYGMDGGAVDISVDYGNSWTRVDFTGSQNIALFGFSPNYTYVASLDPNDPSQKGFTGYRNNWFFTEKTIRPDVDAQLIVRWKFASDYSTIDEGWSIDDVCFTDLGNCIPLGVDEFVENNFGLSQNFPNPANSLTSIEYVIPSSGNVRLVVTDMVGKIVSVLADGQKGSGVHRVDMNTANLSQGMYFYTLTFEGEQITKRMVITK